MPQMSPMLWSLLFIYFILLFMFFNILNYFNFIPAMKQSTETHSTNPLKMNNTLIWKW